MVTRMWFVQIAVLTGFSGAFAQSNVARLKTNLRKSEPSAWSLLVPSVVVHGYAPTRAAAAEMPRRVDGRGFGVMTPGLGFEYADPSGPMVQGAVFKDCYDGLAGTVQLGSFYRVDRDTRVGWSLGVYARQTPVTPDDLPWGFQMTANGYPVDVIPMPFLHLSHRLVASRSFEMDLRMMSNVILNEFGIAVRF